MTTKDLSNRIAERCGMTKKRAEELMSSATRILAETLTSGQTVQWIGLGTLQIKERQARQVILPKSGEKVNIPAKKVLAFRPSDNLKDILK